MNFRKREVQSLLVKLEDKVILSLVRDPGENKIIVWAHKEDETDSQALGIENINLKTGEVYTQRLNLPKDQMYLISVKEILEIQTGEM